MFGDLSRITYLYCRSDKQNEYKIIDTYIEAFFTDDILNNYV